MSFRSNTVPSTVAEAAGVVVVIFEEGMVVADSLMLFVVVVVAAVVAAAGPFELTKFSLSLSAYLLASCRNFSASVNELALSMSNRDRLLEVLKEPGGRMVAVTEVLLLLPIEAESPEGVIVDFVVFVESSESVFL